MHNIFVYLPINQIVKYELFTKNVTQRRIKR